jgi:hypothetical protein
MKTINDSLLEIEGEIVSNVVAENKTKSGLIYLVPKKKRVSRSIKRLEKYKSLILEIQSLEKQANVILNPNNEMRNEEERKVVIDQYSELMSRFLRFMFTQQPMIIERQIGKEAWESIHDVYKFDCWGLQYNCYRIMSKDEWESYFKNVFLDALKKSGRSVNESLKMHEGFISVM